MLKNYIFIINQMGMLILLSILINLMMPLMIYIYLDQAGFFIEFLFMYIFTSMILNYIIYQRLNIKRLKNKHTYKKLYTLGYDMQTIKCVLSTNALFICFVYIIPMLMMYLIARYKEGRSVVIWKQL